MKILVVGINNFIGCNVVKKLLNKGYNIDILISENDELNLEGCNEIIVCNRENITSLSKILLSKKYDFVIDIDTVIREDMMKYLNSSNKSNIGKYILCSSINELNF